MSDRMTQLQQEIAELYASLSNPGLAAVAVAAIQAVIREKEVELVRLYKGPVIHGGVSNVRDANIAQHQQIAIMRAPLHLLIEPEPSIIALQAEHQVLRNLMQRLDDVPENQQWIRAHMSERQLALEQQLNVGSMLTQADFRGTHLPDTFIATIQDIRIIINILSHSPTMVEHAEAIRVVLQSLADIPRQPTQDVSARYPHHEQHTQLREIIARGLCKWIETTSGEAVDLSQYLRQTLVAWALAELVRQRIVPRGWHIALAGITSKAVVRLVIAERRLYRAKRSIGLSITDEAIRGRLKRRLKEAQYQDAVTQLLQDMLSGAGKKVFASALEKKEQESGETPIILWLLAASMVGGGVAIGLYTLIEHIPAPEPTLLPEHHGSGAETGGSSAVRRNIPPPLPPPDQAEPLFERGKLLLATLLVLLLGAGGVAGYKSLSARPLATPTVIALAPTHTPTFMPTSTPIIIPSQTPISTATPTAIPSPTDTPVPPTKTSSPPTRTPIPPPLPTATPAPVVVLAPDPMNEAAERAVVDGLNQQRAANGCNVMLSYVPQLANAARRHSKDMATNNFIGHTGMDESNGGQRILDAGYVWAYGQNGTPAWAENVAAGRSAPEDTVNDWMGSPVHRAHILDCGFHEVGVGYWQADGNDYTFYWTTVFTISRR